MYAMQKHGWVEVGLHSFLTSAQGGEWLASRFGQFIQWKKPLCPFNTRLGGPQSRSGRCGEGKISCYCWESNHDSSVVQPVPCQHAHWTLPAHSVDSSDITSEERPKADLNHNVNTGNVDISRGYVQDDKDTARKRCIGLYHTVSDKRAELNTFFTHTHCRCWPRNGWTTDETRRAEFADRWVETITLIRHMCASQSPTLEKDSKKH
jgi:hypothetical protein